MFPPTFTASPQALPTKVFEVVVAHVDPEKATTMDISIQWTERELTDADFEFDLPDDTLVRDYINQEVSVVGSAIEIELPIPFQEAKSPFLVKLGWFIGLCVVVILVMLVMLAWREKLRGKT